MTQRPAYFEPVASGRYRPTEHAGGAWRDDEIHFSPLGGLITHAIDLHRADRARADQHGDDDKQLGRISFDILGQLGQDECEIQVETIRPGRTIELVQASATIAGRAAVRARAWFIAATDTTEVAGGAPEPLPAPDQASGHPMTETWGGGYVASLEVRAISPARPGRTTAWLRTGTDLVAGESVSPHAAFIALVDTANGIAVRQPPTAWMYPNLDLTVHLHRQPAGAWVGLDTSVTFGPSGLGLTSTTLHDVAGPVGRAEQILTVRPL
ncbi:thioesterase family protein [Occultella gossypii]|uniref:Thioesterase family protein n=1 Tax=Occultella gossypii TaxID=2800820 RepID=A0ABS7SD30_9MICO|nr:thioesterase family protein [Occultella gossypii]MBZ2197619.1 thioesterase family protein [Occultella gossypii]